MTEIKILMLEFLDENGNIYTIKVTPPKDDLSMETVSAVMSTVLDADVFLTSAGRHLTEINNAYYKTVTVEPLPFETEGE